MQKKPTVLCILDGWGISDRPEQSAPDQAKTPHFDRLMATCPNATLTTFGPDVGLPEGQMGNSEVGHMNIGAGRVVRMDLGLIDHAIETDSFRDEPALTDWIATLKDSGGTAHLIGVVSDGGVHGHIDHVLHACQVVAEAGVPVVLHAITDGRDVAPRSAEGFIARLSDLPEGVTVGTLTGRYYAMDRDTRWERVETAWAAMVWGEGEAHGDAAAALSAARARDESDEFIQANVLGDYEGMGDGDGVFCLNFRADRAREILAALGDPEFDGFETRNRPKLHMLGMVDYSVRHNSYMTAVFPKKAVENTLGAWVAQQGLTQFHLAETEKYPHVTFFLNGGKEEPEAGEDRHMPKSPKVATYDLQPEMSAPEVTEHFVAAIERGYDLIVVNYANPDMVGHTGDLAAAAAACEAVDAGLGAALAALEKVGGAMVVCADHGNCETMVDPETGKAHTAHTLNPVPVILVGGPDGARMRDGRLADLAPTVLHLMGVTPPSEMTGQSLIA
ncbi:2,3-bisphosphoglycerate-independent phosphoglycerate mutase [Jannaschia pagri]|uniref:2,3-bisphosphoglycerate-independent phosphoglycerate mutase n=1 Tax=Jannaschia pagri TaxID=2829797 RepID=A0ABQ4NPS0_9RHOB|nr:MULTISPECIES: 2,3-bisphosphoglycerate-independent phosphoglycerate mutase [unclassified Jannaschia]GIT92729.1 2,3-bisphosphoglycerate-independent phosphoglycerate mutase [Jannaschia sp. AI_61]GIT96411.1 2,3-bisphosphoglycerate-independent phosphoglycerate mutase [Jannaschia sp. AI_62]